MKTRFPEFKPSSFDYFHEKMRQGFVVSNISFTNTDYAQAKLMSEIIERNQSDIDRKPLNEERRYFEHHFSMIL